MSLRRWRRSILTLLSVTLLLGAAIGLVLFFELRSIGEFVESVTPIQAVRDRDSISASTSESTSTSTSPATAEDATDSQNSRPSSTTLPSPTQTNSGGQASFPTLAAPTPSNTEVRSSELVPYLVSRFVTGAAPSVRVCEAITELPAAATPNSAMNPQLSRSQLATQLLQTIARTPPPSPFIESLLAPLGALLQIPRVAQLMGGFSNAWALSDPTVLQTNQAGAIISTATADVLSNQATLDQATQHAYHLFVLSRAVALSPNSINRPELLSLCESIESRLTNTDLVSPEVFIDERQALLEVLADAGLTPRQVGYDPLLANGLRVELTRNSIRVSAPWMQRAAAGFTWTIEAPSPARGSGAER